MNLKTALADTGLSQRQIAAELGISTSAVNALANKGLWPAKDTAAVRGRLVKLLVDHGLSFMAAFACLPANENPSGEGKDTHKMIRKQTLLPATKRAFNIRRDPFDEVQSADDLFLSNSIRYVREAMFDTAKHGGMLAVVGESGSGKSTLRRDLVDRVRKEDLPILLIEPYVLGMEDNDKRGKTLKALHIAEAILYTVAPAERCQSSPEARFRQVHRVLRDSARAGHKHCLVLEEAHGLSYPSLKHLKRFYELEDGFSRLLSIILIGQPELKHKLAETSAEVREVVQRMEVVEVHPIDDLRGFAEHRLGKAGLAADKLFAPDAFDALRLKLSGPKERTSGEGASLLYPLVVGNTLIAGLNMAAALGVDKVSADIINRV